MHRTGNIIIPVESSGRRVCFVRYFCWSTTFINKLSDLEVLYQ
jgi:hypothetical protein